jgi:hypothetical protein
MSATTLLENPVGSLARSFRAVAATSTVRRDATTLRREMDRTASNVQSFTDMMASFVAAQRDGLGFNRAVVETW